MQTDYPTLERRQSEGAIVVFFDQPDLKETPMLVQKSDGAALYSTTDLATLAYRIEVSFEEFLEMFGATLILRAALAFARDHSKAGSRLPRLQNVVDMNLTSQ